MNPHATLLPSCLALVLALSACGGAPSTEMEPESELADKRSLARYAFDRQNYNEATTLYEQALRQAELQDDLDAIGELGYARALAALRAGVPRDAAIQADRTHRELARRGAEVPAELYLVEAVARYELGELATADRLAETVLADGADSAARGRAHFILGMSAADQRNRAGLVAAEAALADADEMALRADRQFLGARLAELEGDHATALARFEEAAAMRQELEDHAGMARALAHAGVAAEAAGEAREAADLYFRAGRTAGLIGRREEAREWLTEASRLAEAAGAPALAEDARAWLRGLDR